MTGPVEVAFRDMEPSPPLEHEVRVRLACLESVCPNLVGCRVVFERSDRHYGLGPAVCVRIDLALPDTHVVVNYEPPLDTPPPQADADTRATDVELTAIHRRARTALQQAFDMAQQRLERRTYRRDAGLAPWTFIVFRRLGMALMRVLRSAFGQHRDLSVLPTEGAQAAVGASQSGIRLHETEVCGEDVKKRLELPPYLQQLGTNLNLQARLDRTPPAYGRDREMQQILEVLCHRDRSNSVMLLGEPGVGKTAIVEGLARRIELEPETVPGRLRDCQIVSLPTNALVAGTMLRGMFEERLQHVIREVKERRHLILFIDEAHTLVGAGSALGAPSDAANILKSALARGEIRVIAATTASEYKEHIQEDEALARRFRPVHVAEPTIDETRDILRRLRPRLERNYSVRLANDAIDTALNLTPRYMRHLRLPDKVIGWLDTAAVRAEIEGRLEVTGRDVVSVVARAAQIPEDMVFRDVTDRFSAIEARLQRRVVGQRDAILAVARRLVLNKGPLKDGFDRPDGVLLFLGPTGVGKTELAKALAEFLFGDEKKMVRIDMSEYQNGALGADKLIGMPRGIAGSQRGGILTNQLADTPYSVILLDEIEKASSDVLNLFLQAFDEGWLTDGRGKRVYLSDAIVIMTSNVGSEHFRKLTNPLGFLPGSVDVAQLRGDVRRELERRFSPELLNRIDEIVTFAPLTRADAREIAMRYLASITRTLARAGKTIVVDDEAVDLIVTQGHSLVFGARFLKRVIDEQVKLPISTRWSEASDFHVCVVGNEVRVETASRPANVCGELAPDYEHVA